MDEAVAALPVPVKPRSEGALSAKQRGQKAAQKVLMGEITRARQCLTGAPLAPGNDDTFNELQRKRPQEVVRELPDHVRAFADAPLAVNKKILLKSLKSSPRGSSPGEDPQRERERERKSENGSGRGKKARNFCFVFSSCCFFFLIKKAKRLKHQFWPKMVWPKSVKIVWPKSVWPKSDLAKFGISR